MQKTDNCNALDELVLCALHYLHTANKPTLLLLYNLRKDISSMQLSNVLYRGKGIVEVVRILENKPKKNRDIEELLLL